MVLNRKGSWAIGIVFAFLFALVIFFTIRYETMARGATFDPLGQHQLEILKTAQQSESIQLYIDTAAGFAADVALQSMLNSGVVPNASCPSFTTAQFWTYSNATGSGSQFVSCYPTVNEFESVFELNFQRELRDRLGALSHLPLLHYEVVTKQQGEWMHIRALPDSALQFTVGQDAADAIHIREDASPLYEAVLEGQFDFTAEVLQAHSYRLSSIPAPFHYRVRRNPIKRIILHHTSSSTLRTAIQNLRSQKNSYHYIIDRDGMVYKLLPENVEAIHAGCQKNVDGMECVDEYANWNSIAIAFVNRGSSYQGSGGLRTKDGFSWEPFSLDQVEAVRKLITALSQKYDIPLDVLHIQTHRDILTSVQDVGPTYSFNRFFKEDTGVPANQDTVVSVTQNQEKADRHSSIGSSEFRIDTSINVESVNPSGVTNNPIVLSELTQITENTVESVKYIPPPAPFVLSLYEIIPAFQITIPSPVKEIMDFVAIAKDVVDICSNETIIDDCMSRFSFRAADCESSPTISLTPEGDRQLFLCNKMNYRSRYHKEPVHIRFQLTLYDPYPQPVTLGPILSAGEVLLQWTSTPQTRRVEIYRSDKDYSFIDDLEPLVSLGPDSIAYADFPDAAGPYYYAIVSVDRYGRRSSFQTQVATM